MNTFTLLLEDATQIKTIDNVASFVGEDDSGSFGIMAGHGRFMTILVLGLARFRLAQQPWQYVALPGGLLYFHDDILSLSTRHFLLDSDYMRISNALQQQLLAEEEKLNSIKESLHRMEEEVFKRMWQLRRREI